MTGTIASLVPSGTDLLARADPMSRRVTWDEVAVAAPEAVLFLPCGYPLADAVAEARRIGLADRVPGAAVWALDATRLASRCTPQAVTAGARALARVLHPDVAGDPDPADAVRIA
jgi:iron complex transport system substrate-binding protein